MLEAESLPRTGGFSPGAMSCKREEHDGSNYLL
jgi:hypothetical protein